jgi:hypothetical protein
VDGTGRRLIEPIQETQERALAGTARSCNRQDVSSRGIEGRVIDESLPGNHASEMGSSKDHPIHAVFG